MAERFEIPKRFSKKWWSYFWEYYKWFVIIGLCIVLAVVYTVFEIKNQPNHLFNVTYAGEHYFMEETKDKLSDFLSQGMSEEENDGVNFAQLNLDNSENADIQMQSALLQKLSLEYITDETMLFLFDKETLDSALTNGSSKDIWEKVSDWAETDVETYGEYAVSLKGCKLFESTNINTENLYMAVRKNYHPDNEDASKRHNYSIIAANRLIAE